MVAVLSGLIIILSIKELEAKTGIYDGDGVKISLYNRKTLGMKSERCLLSSGLRKLNNFSRDLPTKVIIHGWWGTDNNFLIKVMRKDVLPIEDMNMLVVDWSGGGSRNLVYTSSRNKIHKVAEVVAKFLDDFSELHEVNLQDIHIIGHSLGAQISGIIGSLVTKGKIGRITGLDPANPLFNLKTAEGRLSHFSASFVDVIHTCGGFLGKQEPLGHADFYPNHGTWVQPGCVMDITGVCSHLRSYYFYRDSFRNRKAFPAIKCDSWKDFKEMKNCDFQEIVYMGEAASPSARGKYYLRTKKMSPYGYGEYSSNDTYPM